MDYQMNFHRLQRGRLTWQTLTVLCAVCLLAVATGANGQDVIVLRGATIETMGPAGRIEQGEILIEDGIIREVGERVTVPDRAKVIDVSGRTILPGIVDPYFVMNIPLGGEAPEEPRVVTFGGRTFTIPSNRGSTPPATFVRLADVFDERYGEWDRAIRSGITTVNLVTSGYGQSAVGHPLDRQTLRQKKSAAEGGSPVAVNADSAEASEPPAVGSAAVHPIVQNAEAGLYTTVTNNSASLKTIRDGLRDPNRGGSERRGGGESSGASGRGGRGTGGGRGGPPAENASSATASNGSRGTAASTSPAQKLWESVRSGETPLLVNANNAAAILYLIQEQAKAEKAKLAVVASGPDWYQTMKQVPKDRMTVILPPRIDTEPGNQNRINVPHLLDTAGVRFVFSLSSARTEFQAMQATPLFPVAMLVKAGLSRKVALEALTIGPAKLLGLEKEIGSIEVGKRADLTVLDADPLDSLAEVVQVWVAGENVYGN